MGELLSESSRDFDSSSTFTWNDVRFREDDSLLLHVKLPKSRSQEGEFVDIFSFKTPGCCPVKALRKQLNLQRSIGRGRPSDPVFVLQDQSFLTEGKMNQVLVEVFSGVLGSEKDSLSCHSFRAGVPSALSRHPDLASSDDIQGWGRWSSSCYKVYTRLKIDQKKKIYSKILWALE